MRVLELVDNQNRNCFVVQMWYKIGRNINKRKIADFCVYFPLKNIRK